LESGRKNSGFTLIELLVVIAIIAILAAILYPVLIAAKARAREMRCMTNTNQLTKAVLLYAGDYNNYSPGGWVWGSDCWTSDVTKGSLWPYLKSGVRNGAITCCPDDRPDANGRRRKWSITLNGFLCGGVFWYIHGGPATTSGINLSIFRQPNRLPAFICENTDLALAAATGGNVVNDTVFCNNDITSARHGGYAAITFLDGHSGRLKHSLMFNTAKYPDGTYIFRPMPP